MIRVSLERLRNLARIAATAWLVATLLLGSGLPATILAASPEPSLITNGDPRSEGQGPGVTGQPLVILLGVLVLGVSTAAVTLLLVRLKRDD